MNPLTPAQRRALRAKAHHLQPVVIVGQHGLSPAVLNEVDLALEKHELIKVRVFSDDRTERERLLAKLCAEMECAAVQHLGKVFVLWREGPEEPKPAPQRREPKAATKSGAKRPKPPRTGPRAPIDPVRERRRGTGSDAADSGKGRRGAARHAPAGEGVAPAPRRPRGSEAPGAGSAGPTRYRGGEVVPSRPRTREPVPEAGGARPPRGAAGSSRQKIRALGAGNARVADAPGPRGGNAPGESARRKSTYTPKTTPKSFSAKPNPREAWAKRPAAGAPKPSAGGTRRRRKA
jgi:RNA-binding protein